MTDSRSSIRHIIAANGIASVMAAHSPLSAYLAEEAGFDGIWASGFELSALYGLPDVSLVSMTQHLDMVRAMAERTAEELRVDDAGRPCLLSPTSTQALATRSM